MITQQRQIIIKKYIFLVFTHLQSKEPHTPCFHHSKLKVDEDCGLTIFFFSAITVNFPCSSTIAESIVYAKVNAVTIKAPLFFKHAPETWFSHFSTLRRLQSAPPSFIGAFMLYPLTSLSSWHTWSETLEKILIEKSRRGLPSKVLVSPLQCLFPLYSAHMNMYNPTGIADPTQSSVHHDS